MKRYRYSLVCLLCVLLILCTGCVKSHDDVVNAKSAIIINSSDFGGSASEKVAASQKNNTKVTRSGNVIHMGGGYDDIPLQPVFNN